MIPRSPSSAGKPLPPDRWCKTFKGKWLTLEVSRFINTQCLSLGFSFNWNYRMSIEVDFFICRVYLERTK